MRLSIYRTLSIATIFVLLISACELNKNRKKVDLSTIDLSIKVERFEQDLLSIDTSDIQVALSKLESKYGRYFLDIYFENILNVRSPFTSEEEASFFKLFVVSPPMQTLNDTVQSHFPDLEKEVGELTQAFKYFRYYFPEHQLPEKAYTFISEFGYGAVTVDSSILGIGLDLYLGTNYRLYSNYFPAYMLNKFDSDRIAVDGMRAIYNFHFEDSYRGGTLVYNMIEAGKQSVFLEYMMPDAGPHLYFGYSKEEWDWCEKNEDLIWKFLIDQELLFTTDPVNRRNFIGEGPGSGGMPEEAPGNLGVWIGNKIINATMRRKKYDLKEIMTMESEKIYQLSNYKPSRFR